MCLPSLSWLRLMSYLNVPETCDERTKPSCSTQLGKLMASLQMVNVKSDICCRIEKKDEFVGLLTLQLNIESYWNPIRTWHCSKDIAENCNCFMEMSFSESKHMKLACLVCLTCSIMSEWNFYERKVKRNMKPKPIFRSRSFSWFSWLTDLMSHKWWAPEVHLTHLKALFILSILIDFSSQKTWLFFRLESLWMGGEKEGERETEVLEKFSNWEKLPNFPLWAVMFRACSKSKHLQFNVGYRVKVNARN